MNLDVFFISIFSAFLTIFLNYCFGKPASKEFSGYEIFSFYTVWLSKKRLKNVGLLRQYENQFEENEERIKSKSQHITLKNDYRKIYYEAAEPFFTWERAAGMCPICFGVWIAGIVWFGIVLINRPEGMILTDCLINLLIVVLISHVVIRLLTKII